MHKHVLQGKWHAFSGRIKKRWGRMTKNELVQLKGNGEEIFGILQKHYGYTAYELGKSIKTLLKTASMKKFNRMALRSRVAVAKTVQSNPIKAVMFALTTGVIIGHLSRSKIN